MPNFRAAANNLRWEIEQLCVQNEIYSIITMHNKLSGVLQQEHRYWKQRSNFFLAQIW